jgi:ABC-type sugar transport system ATPase subunit
MDNTIEENVLSRLSSIAVEHLTCDFPGVRALNDLSLEFRAGEIHALAGENGAGKSTLLKVLAGLVVPTRGEVAIGEQRVFRVQHALSLGIRTIPQEPVLAPDLSIAENLLMGKLPRKSLGQIDWKTVFETGQRLLQRVGLDHLPAQSLVAGLGVAEQQLIEIARALSGKGDVFLFDEPTSSLAAAEVARLGEILIELRRSGKVVLYVSHRLDEIFSFCDRVSVLRDGNLVATKLVSDTDPDALIRLMVGREILKAEASRVFVGDAPCLTVSGLTVTGVLTDINFLVRRGEIVGVAGLVGAGRTTLLQTLFGVHRLERGEISLNGMALKIRSPKDAMSAGIAYVPEDRKHHGLALNLSVAENFALPNLRQLGRFGVLRKRKRDQLARSYAERLNLRYQKLSQLALLLSGGNQQKIVVGKWLARNPLVLLLDEPTRGIDVGAKSEIYSLIRELTLKGVSILLVSSELAELLALSNRIIVMREGRLSGELSGDAMNEESILRLATPGFYRRDEGQRDVEATDHHWPT